MKLIGHLRSVSFAQPQASSVCREEGGKIEGPEEQEGHEGQGLCWHEGHGQGL